MKLAHVIPIRIPVLLLGVLLVLTAFLATGALTASAGGVLHVPAQFATIQLAVDAAGSGDIIQVAAGTYDNVVINGKEDIELRGNHATLKGSGDLADGIGLKVLDSKNIRVQGFTIEDYELGVLLFRTHNSRLQNMEIRNNDSDDRGLQDGIQLDDSDGNLILNVDSHDNGHNGLTLKGGSSGNTVRSSSFIDNGLNKARKAGFQGCGIQLGRDGNNNNSFVSNEILRNAWGILLPGERVSGDPPVITPDTSTGNVIAQNRVHGNARAGIAVRNGTSGNFILQNNAKGNGLENLGPSLTSDLFGDLDNTWQNNQGVFLEH